MLINKADWQRVAAAYDSGAAQEADFRRALRGVDGLDEVRIREDLKRLAKCIAECHDDTLRVVELQTPWALDRHGVARPVLSDGLLAGYVADAQEVMRRKNEGKRYLTPWRHREAVAVLRELWPGKKATGRPNPYFNPMTKWIASQLQKLDPALAGDDNIEAARSAAQAALKALDAAQAARDCG